MQIGRGEKIASKEGKNTQGKKVNSVLHEN